MAATPEKIVKKRVYALLDLYGAYYFSPMTHGYGRSGVPDIIACYEGKFLGIECKAGKNQPTALQQRELDNINKSGGFDFVVRLENMHELEAWLKLLVGSPPQGGDESA